MSINTFKSIATILFSCLLLIACKKETIHKNDGPVDYQLTGSIYKQLIKISNDSLTKRRVEKTEEFWAKMKDSLSVPFVKNDTALFLYYGEANKVEWNGDFNSWGSQSNFQNDGKNIDSTKLWYLLKTFPKDARLDYKITLNGSQWILDPYNPMQQWSGFGPNSVLAMPEWEKESITQKQEGVPSGELIKKQTQSSQLEYEVSYKVYLPHNYSNEQALATLYVTDGHEYSDEKLGSMITVLDNLISSQSIKPIIVTFVDPRNPNNLNQNRRQDEYVVNSAYLAFVENELIPEIEQSYNTSTEERGILGTSLGGLNASYFGSSQSNLFQYVAAQSPAYWYNTSIFDLVRNDNIQAQKVFISAGTFNDGLENAKKMKSIYDEKNATISFKQVNEGHSWGAWRQQLDDILLFFYGI